MMKKSFSDTILYNKCTNFNRQDDIASSNWNPPPTDC